jgi:hypothetical protein
MSKVAHRPTNASEALVNDPYRTIARALSTSGPMPSRTSSLEHQSCLTPSRASHSPAFISTSESFNAASYQSIIDAHKSPDPRRSTSVSPSHDLPRYSTDEPLLPPTTTRALSDRPTPSFRPLRAFKKPHEVGRSEAAAEEVVESPRLLSWGSRSRASRRRASQARHGEETLRPLRARSRACESFRPLADARIWSGPAHRSRNRRPPRAGGRRRRRRARRPSPGISPGSRNLRLEILQVPGARGVAAVRAIAGEVVAQLVKPTARVVELRLEATRFL